jgi:hypothetical protein
LTSAGGLVRVADRFTIPATVAGIDEDLRIDFRALLLLASPSAPIAAAQAAVELAATGSHITRAEADELIGRQWVPWLREHDISRSTADRLLHIAERFDPICSAAGQIDEFNIDFRALQLLAARTVRACQG